MTKFSHSKLSCFENCRLQYKYKYVDKLKMDGVEGIEAFLGKRVHETFERLYKDLRYEKVNSLDELLNFYKEEWEKAWHGGVEIVKQQYTAENYKEMGIRYISDYYHRYHPFDQTKTIGLEMPIQIQLDDGGYTLRGYIDRLSEKDGTYYVHDYKTSQYLPSQEKLDEDRQLALYALAVREKYPDVKDVELIWHYVAFDKELHSTRTEEQLELLKGEVLSAIVEVKQAEQAGEFPLTTSALCDWCEYKPICPAWKHLYGTEQLATEEFFKDDGVNLVNSYASLKRQRDTFLASIEPELEKLEQAILEYSEKNNVNALNGSDVIANIKWSEDAKFPGVSDERRAELEEAIKKLGKWDEVSSLSASTLKSILKKKKWTEEELTILDQFATLEKKGRVSLSSK